MITSPKGFYAAGYYAGLKKNQEKKDMAIIYSEVPAVTAGTFTRNKVKAAPVKWGQKLIKEQETASAVIINSGIANACTGEPGMDNCIAMAQKTGDALGLAKEQVLVASTGVIGVQLPMDIINNGIEVLTSIKSQDAQSAENAAMAILTTDTCEKEITVTTKINDKTVTVSGMAKGSGMIHPNMGTMLSFITTDAAISKELLQEAVYDSVQDTFNMISVDGDTSTNDTEFVLANGLAGNQKIVTKNEDYELFVEALDKVNTHLAKAIAADGEGATKLFEVRVVNAPTKEDARMLSKAVVCSSLTKAAIFGEDANWGRIFCAMGYSGADINPETSDIYLKSEYGTAKLVENGLATDYSEEEATKILSADKVICLVDIKAGNETATAWGCDLTYDYVKINGDYRS